MEFFSFQQAACSLDSDALLWNVLGRREKKWSFEFVGMISAIGGFKCRYLSLDVSSREDFEKLLVEDGML